MMLGRHKVLFYGPARGIGSISSSGAHRADLVVSHHNLHSTVTAPATRTSRTRTSRPRHQQKFRCFNSQLWVLQRFILAQSASFRILVETRQIGSRLSYLTPALRIMSRSAQVARMDPTIAVHLITMAAPKQLPSITISLYEIVQLYSTR